MNLDYDFVQVWKFSEDQKKTANRTLFLPEFRWRPKKKVFSKNIFFSPILDEDQKKQNKIKKKVFSTDRTLFSPNLLSAVHPFKLLGGMQKWTILKLLGGIYSLIWTFRHHWLNLYSLPASIFFIVTTLSKKQQLCFAVSSAVARATEVWGGTSQKWGGTSRKWGSTKTNWTFAHKNWYFTAIDFNNFVFMAEKQTYKAGSVS